VTTDRKAWTPTDVVDVTGPPALLRNYLEQRDVRAYLQQAASRHAIQRACDVGSGFGRLTPVLSEVAHDVIGFEREATLVGTARRLLPALRFEHVATLEQLPAADASVQFVLTFTVLQHMPDPRAESVLSEIRRMLAPGGHLLLVEETDTTLEAGDPARADLGYTRGRPVAWYVEHFRPCALVATSPRVIEPGYPRPDVGTYMLLQRS
jgi:SAM-dependent methyltransferase